ncbi:hypothetical protein ACS0TY_025270 [Phlomoides rotata]
MDLLHDNRCLFNLRFICSVARVISRNCDILSFVSILLLSFKASVFTINSQLEDEASTSLSRRRLHLKKSWGMPVLFLSSVVFALGHIVVAYRTSCKARRKIMLHRIDPEAVLSCKIVFSSYQKVPRSPTPAAVSLLAGADSLFISCQGLTVHYKLCLPGLPSRSLSSTTFFVQPSLSRPLKNHHNIHRSNSNTFHSSLSPLYTPLLASSPTSFVSEDVPIFCLNENCEDDELGKLGSPLMVAGWRQMSNLGLFYSMALVEEFSLGERIYLFNSGSVGYVLFLENGCWKCSCGLLETDFLVAALSVLWKNLLDKFAVHKLVFLANSLVHFWTAIGNYITVHLQIIADCWLKLPDVVSSLVGFTSAMLVESRELFAA